MCALQRPVTIALAGNPNSGKTTIFNNLTGSRQHVGNYPGVTIEKKEGECRYRGEELRIVDLPGTYSLTALSPEETVARNYLVRDKPDAVICVVDTSNLERNLYLAVQLMELQIPLVLAFNMMDVVEARGDRLDMSRLSEILKVPIVATVGYKRQGMDSLMEQAVRVAALKPADIGYPTYSTEIEESLQAILIRMNGGAQGFRHARWTAIQLLENDLASREQRTGSPALDESLRQSIRLTQTFGDPPETLMVQERYLFIARSCDEAVQTMSSGPTWSDKLDSVMTHRLYGLPLFLAAMFVVFWATFNLSSIPCGWIESWLSWLSATVSSWWPAQPYSPIRSLIVDGIIGGVGNVIVFLPNILILFFAIGILEDSGYMPRAAFIMDRLMHRVGLHGKSSIPLLLGFGCSVPAIMATRTLKNRRDRLTTMLISPLMSCGARLPIYALIIPAFFPRKWQAPMLWLIYLTGIVLAIAAAKLLKATLFKGQETPFIMELPPYRIPRFRDTCLQMWERSSMYLKKAGTVILGISILLWVLTAFPRQKGFPEGGQVPISSEAAHQDGKSNAPRTAAIQDTEPAGNPDQSYASRIGHLLEPALVPMGFDWKIGTALLGAVAAKEVFVAQMGIVYTSGENEAPLREQLRQHYSPLVGFCIMIFCLISAPCMSTIAVTWRESGSWHWAFLQFFGLTVLAYVLTALVYQTGTWLKIGI